MKLFQVIVVAVAGVASVQAPALGQAPQVCEAPGCITIPDEKNYTRDEFLLYLAPWSRFYDKTLERITDYEDTAQVRPETFPDNTVINWRWPTGDLPKGAGVWGYHHIAYGNLSDGVTERSVEPQQVNSITSLNEDFAFSYEGSENFNLLTETYLTRNRADHTSRVVEVGFFLHAPQVTIDWLQSAEEIGTFADSQGVTWTVRRSEDFVTFTPPPEALPILSGTLDFKGAFDFLVERGVISGDEWFNGLGFGIEPTKGGGEGSLTIDKLSVDFR